MSPIESIQSLDTLLQRLDQLRSTLAREVAQVQSQWQQLGRVGNQREDHAAALLRQLTPALNNLGHFCLDAQQQIATMQADPFA